MKLYRKEIDKKFVLIDTDSENYIWVADLLERGILEHETSYGNTIPIPEDLKNDLKKFIEDAQYKADNKGDWRCSECDYKNNPEGISFCFNCFQPK
jgi:hypothetical protein